MTHKLTDFSPKPSLLHVVISSVIRFDKSLYPVVLYEKYVVCIFIIAVKTYEKMMKESLESNVSTDKELGSRG